LDQQEIANRARLAAPVTGDDIEALTPLIEGVIESVRRLREVLPEFPAELDGGSLSRTVNGNE
jgi:hypothetical protein